MWGHQDEVAQLFAISTRHLNKLRYLTSRKVGIVISTIHYPNILHASLRANP